MNPPTAPRLNQLLKTVRQPQWIAAGLSIGFHVVLFAAGPSFSSLNVAGLGENEPNAEERQVPLIELSPDEQGRLPDFSSPAYSLFPSGDDDDLFSLFPPSGNSLPLDSDSDFGASLSIPAPRLPSSSLPSSISPFIGSGRSSIVLPSRRSTLPPISSGGTLPRPTQNPAAAGNGNATASAPTATPPGGSNGTASDLSTPEGNGADSGTIGSSPETAAANPETPAAERASELLARVEYSETQTSAAEVEIAKAAWLRTVQEKLGNDVAQASEPITLQVPYSGRLCLSPEPTDGLLGLVGLPNDDNDDLKLWTAVLKSTGYPFLNQAAEQALQGIVQQADEAGGTLEPNTLYQVVLEVEYDRQTCISREALLQSRTTDNDEPEAAQE
ncbi:hypothetical protein [Nodosilinea sp. E11]|uniref:hypothetical protein n=1 Tax=Nodosilinea sp. E11 TaxID=3037479 RepID=UPI002934FCC8|nr:hypothetical protein [Nodosilinea sp. E11]WOD38029.1 hypothetical protein RRF56_17600 [Nodosilinea sp. E11]